MVVGFLPAINGPIAVGMRRPVARPHAESDLCDSAADRLPQDNQAGQDESRSNPDKATCLHVGFSFHINPHI